jgi:hypothetical protein
MRVRLAIAAMTLVGACFGPQCSVGRQRNGPDPNAVSELAERMCACRDRACADRINEEMTHFGTEMAAYGRLTDERPNPSLVEKSRVFIARYTECMAKLLVADAAVISRP